MPGEDIIIMRGKELKRLHVIHKLNEKKIKQQEASELLGLCVRQVRRILKRVLKEGGIGIIHKSRGRPSNRLLSEDLKNRAIRLYWKKYSDFGPTLANEKMEEIEDRGYKGINSDTSQLAHSRGFMAAKEKAQETPSVERAEKAFWRDAADGWFSS